MLEPIPKQKFYKKIMSFQLLTPNVAGKLNSIYGACEALTPLLYAPMYAYVYTHTINTLPGTFLLLGAALLIPGISIFG